MIKKSQITFLYTLAICTVAGLIIGNQLVANYLLKSAEADANVINIAGKQRMLSQKIALNAHKALDDFSYFDIVISDTKKWKSVHNTLKHGDAESSIPFHNSTNLKKMFKDIDSHVEVISHLVEAIESESELALFIHIISEESAFFLPKMDAIVNQFQSESEARLERMEVFEMFMTVLSIFILGIEFLFIFNPIISELDKNNKQLQKANHSKDRIIATVAHDLRSPINGIQGMVQMVREDLNEHTSSDHDMMFDLVDDACNKSTNLIQELLDMSVLENENFQLKREQILLKEYLLQTIAHFKDKAESKGVDLTVFVEKDVLTVSIDQKRFGRVIDNLLSNALKFTSSPGEVAIESFERENSVIIRVKDTGIGIPEDMQKFIFDKFSKARRSGLDGEQTTGLGMSIVKQIVELHKGKIWVESRENVGTQFFIELPKVA